MSLEGRKKKKKKRNRKEFKLTKEKTTRVIACYCWREVGHLFQSLLFGFFSLVAVVFVCVCFFLLGLCHFYGQL